MNVDIAEPALAPAETIGNLCRLMSGPTSPSPNAIERLSAWMGGGGGGWGTMRGGIAASSNHLSGRAPVVPRGRVSLCRKGAGGVGENGLTLSGMTSQTTWVDG